MLPKLRAYQPAKIRKPRKPKITPLAPTCTELPAPRSQAAIPPPSMASSATSPKWRASRSMTSQPRIRSEAVFAVRCARSAWRNGASTMPRRPLTVRGTTPYCSSDPPNNVFTAKTAQIDATETPSTAACTLSVRTTRMGLGVRSIGRPSVSEVAREESNGTILVGRSRPSGGPYGCGRSARGDDT